MLLLHRIEKTLSLKGKVDGRIYQKSFGLWDNVRHKYEQLLVNDYGDIIDEIGRRTSLKVSMGELTEQDLALIAKNSTGSFWSHPDNYMHDKMPHLMMNIDIIKQLAEASPEDKERIFQLWEHLESLRPIDYLSGATSSIKTMITIPGVQDKLAQIVKKYPDQFQEWSGNNTGTVSMLLAFDHLHDLSDRSDDAEKGWRFFDELMEDDTPAWLTFKGDSFSIRSTAANLRQKSTIEQAGLSVAEGYRFTQVYGNFSLRELGEIKSAQIDGQSLMDYLLSPVQLGFANHLHNLPYATPAGFRKAILEGPESTKRVFDNKDKLLSLYATLTSKHKRNISESDYDRVVANQIKVAQGYIGEGASPIVTGAEIDEMKDVIPAILRSIDNQEELLGMIKYFEENSNYKYNHSHLNAFNALVSSDNARTRAALANLFDAGWVMSSADGVARDRFGVKAPLIVDHIQNSTSLDIILDPRFTGTVAQMYGGGERFDFSDLGLVKSLMNSPNLLVEYMSTNRDELSDKISAKLVKRDKWTREHKDGYYSGRDIDVGSGLLGKADLYKISLLVDYFDDQNQVDDLFSYLVDYHRHGTKPITEKGGQSRLSSLGLEEVRIDPASVGDPHTYAMSAEYFKTASSMIANWHSHGHTGRGYRMAGPSGRGLSNGDLKVAYDNQWDGWVVSILEDNKSGETRQGRLNIDFYTQNGLIVDLGVFDTKIPIMERYAPSDTAMNLLGPKSNAD